MKKILALLLVLCMSLTACGAFAEASPRYRIGFVYGDLTTKLGEQFVNGLNFVAEDLNIEIVTIEAGFGEQGTATLESVAAAGTVDGIISAAGASPAFLKAVNGIPFVACGSAFPSDPEELKETASNKNFLGGVVDSDYNAGYSAAKSLYEAGCRNLCIAGLTQGLSAAHDARIKGVNDFLAEHPDYKLLADDYSRAQYAPAISAFAAAFPEMDSLFTSSCNDAVFTTMMTEGLIGTVKMGSVDITETTGEYFDNGTLAYVAGGQYGSVMVALALLYNHLADGTDIISNTMEPMTRDYIVINNAEQFADYLYCVDGKVPVYTGEEIKNMIHFFNGEANYDTIQAINDQYSIEDIKTRHADMLG